MRWPIATLFFVLSHTNNALVNGGWVDEDTPEEKRVTKSLIDGTEYKLVMSDEFNVEGRSFKDGDDPTWTALDKSDDDASAAGGGSLIFYNSSMVTTTKDGKLELKSIIDKTEWEHFDVVKQKYHHITKHFKSSMVQSWNKFCFTGGIVEVDIMLPGDPHIGGLWPAVWLLGNLGRATYEGSTNNIWPWSYDTCDRKKQEAQTISACNAQNHFGLNPFQGRGATEIDIIEVSTGKASDILEATNPRLTYPYADVTLQIAPGITENRPTSGHLPTTEDTLTASGFTEFLAQNWYKDLETNGNTTINPYFYGTYLAETKPQEPVHRNKNQVFQADAVGAATQLTKSHFQKMHTLRLEWQPGPGGRLDWYMKNYKINSNTSITGDGNGQDWVRVFTVKDESLNVTGAQIPVEPSSIIMNTGISSTWGFPAGVPDDCAKCYDCSNATCACSFNPGFCNMMKKNVSMFIDYVRVYQSDDHDAHVGLPHSVGCDPVEYPTKEYIKGHEYLYMRSPPFVYDDKGPIAKKINNGGGECKTNSDCGGVDTDDSASSSDAKGKGRGECVKGQYSQGLFVGNKFDSRCKCNDGYIGPNCLSLDKKDDIPGAYEMRSSTKLFKDLPSPTLPITLVGTISTLILTLFVVACRHVLGKHNDIIQSATFKTPQRPIS
jgi:hypothetical protein